MAVEYLPNMGIPPGHVRPVDIDHLYPEKDASLMVELIVTAAAKSNSSRDNHWMLAWELGRVPGGAGTPVHRRVGIVKEISVNHLTNWGAMTKAALDMTMVLSLSINLKMMSREQRRELETIGNKTPVRKPDGTWNCQDWVITVLGNAVAAGVITDKEQNIVVKAAQGIIFS